jgi:flagellar assembly factor FliW
MIQTKYHGEIEINNDDILHFEKGIPGFLDEKEFMILPLSDDGTYSIMQSLSAPMVAFVVASPFNYFPNYEFQLEDTAIEELELRTEKDVLVFSILSVGEPFENTTVNLQAPIIINSTNHKAKQIILNNTSYKIKHPIFQEG